MKMTGPAGDLSAGNAHFEEFMSPSSDTIRSFALVGHSGAGKTHTADAIARLTGLNNRLGSPGEGTSLFDYEPEEQKRGGSISSHLLSCDYDGFRIHILDTPGDGNFLHDAQICLQGVDAAMLVISAVDGIEVSTERMSALAAEMGLPRAIFINKMDRERADYQHVLSELKEVLGVEPVLLQLPLGRETAFKGVIDLVDRKVWTYNGDGGAPTQGPIPEELEDEVEVAVESMVESVAMADDALVEKYLEEGELSSEELRNGLNKGITEGTLCPVLLGSAALNIGVDRMLWLARAFPGPSDREGFGAEDDTVVEANSAGGFALLQDGYRSLLGPNLPFPCGPWCHPGGLDRSEPAHREGRTTGHDLQPGWQEAGSAQERPDRRPLRSLQAQGHQDRRHALQRQATGEGQGRDGAAPDDLVHDSSQESRGRGQDPIFA